jgi:hypothetical protein
MSDTITFLSNMQSIMQIIASNIGDSWFSNVEPIYGPYFATFLVNNYSNFANISNSSNWDYASNTAQFASNSFSNLTPRLSNYATIESLSSYVPLSYMTNYGTVTDTTYASNTATWDSNALSNLGSKTDTEFASNTVVWTSNSLGGVVSAVGVLSNDVAWTSNNMSSVSNLSTTTQVASMASNTAYWASNIISTFSNTFETLAEVDLIQVQMSNWTYASNALSNVVFAYEMSNYATTNVTDSLQIQANTFLGKSTFASNTAVQAYDSLSNYALSIVLSNYADVQTTGIATFSSNTSVYASNALSNLVSANQMSNFGSASDTAFASNSISNLSSFVTTQAISNYVLSSDFQSNVGDTVYASNSVSIAISASEWTSNNLSSISNLSEIANAASVSSNTAFWASNILATFSNTFETVNSFTPLLDGASNWNYASNTSTFASNSLSNLDFVYLSNVAIWASNLVGSNNDNWTYGSNVANFLSNRAYFNPSPSNGIFTSCNVGLAGASNPVFNLHLARDSAAKPTNSMWTIINDDIQKQSVQFANLASCYSNVKSIPLMYFTWSSNVYSSNDILDRSTLGFSTASVSHFYPKSVSRVTVGSNSLATLNKDQIYMAMYGAVQYMQLKMQVYENMFDMIQDQIAVLTPVM